MIICEVGLNHLGSEKIAIEYIDAVVNTRADALTFQVLMDSFYKNEKYARFKLRNEFFIEALKKTKNRGKRFGVAIDDETAVLLLEDNGIDFFKVLSKDFNNYKLIDKLLEVSEQPIYISTGMNDLKEIEELLSRYNSKKNRITLIQTQLSNLVGDVNFEAISSIKARFDISVAFGFHCSNHKVLYMSPAYKPESIFFYVKKGDNKGYPDDKHAIPLQDVCDVVDDLKELPGAIGCGEKVSMDDWA